MDQATEYDGRLYLLSGMGADLTEKSRTSFARYKGMAENHLIGIELGGLHIFRPGYIYPVEKRTEPNFSYRLLRWLYPVLGGFVPSVTSEDLGLAMYELGKHGSPLETLENKDIRSVHG